MLGPWIFRLALVEQVLDGEGSDELEQLVDGIRRHVPLMLQIDRPGRAAEFGRAC